MNGFSTLLLAAASIAMGIPNSWASEIYSVTFDGSTGNSISGVTGGTATLINGGEGGSTSAVVTTDSMGAGGYLRMKETARGGAGAIFKPAAEANSLNAWSSSGGQALNGGFDFFIRPTVAMDSSSDGKQLNPIYVDPVPGGVGLTMSSGWNAVLKLELLNQSGTAFSNITSVVGSQYGAADAIQVGNMTTLPLEANHVYHVGVMFSTDASNLVTAKLFIVEGTGAIDTKSTTGLTGHVTFNLAANNGFHKGEIKFGDIFGLKAPQTTDFDSFRIYNAAPDSFPALMEDTEEGTLASVELAAPLRISQQ